MPAPDPSTQRTQALARRDIDGSLLAPNLRKGLDHPQREDGPHHQPDQNDANRACDASRLRS